MSKSLRGVCTPICTLFTADGGGIDEGALRAHVDALVEAGVHCIAACGGTGEFSFLRPDERRRVAEIVASQLDGRAGLIVHASAVLTEETIEYAKHAEGLGADALLVLPPYFEGPNLDGVFEHYERVATAVGTPIMAYNIPVHSGIDLDPAFMARLQQIDSIKYLKDSTGDFLRLLRLVDMGIEVFVGCDPMMFHGLLAGAAGCFWGSSNAIPAEAAKLYELTTAGQLDGARELWSRIYRLNDFVWTHPFNPSVKAAARALGCDLGECRRPVQPLTPDELAELNEALAALR